MPKTRPTHAERWLASGHRYDDLELWRELCQVLEARGLTPTAELPEHLAPLVYRDPENAFLHQLRDQLLTPVQHVRGRARMGGNGWRVEPDWHDRLQVLQSPTPDALLRWWYTLEHRFHATYLIRQPQAQVQIFDQRTPDPHEREVVSTRFMCQMCWGRSWNDDPRGIRHDWSKTGGRGDCLLLRVRRNIRMGESERLAQRDRRRAAEVHSQLDEVCEHYLQLGTTYRYREYDVRAAQHWAASAESDGLWRLSWAALHIAELFGAWIMPTRQEGAAYVRYLRSAGTWPVGTGVERVQQAVREFYVAAALRLEKVLASLP